MAVPSSDTYSIPPPPLRTYPSADEAEEAIHAWTKEHLYNVSRKGVETNDSKEVIMRRFECDRAGKPKNTRQLSSADRVRKKRGSKRIGCPMRLRIVAVDTTNATGAWRVEYTKDGSENHNHPPSQDVRVHVAHRQRAAKRSALEQTDHFWKQAFQIVANGLERSTCNGVFRQTQGRPCLHDLMTIIDSDGVLNLEPCHFDTHWWLPIPDTERVDDTVNHTPDHSDARGGATSKNPMRLLAPLTLSRGNGKRRKSNNSRSHQTGHGLNSTRRDPSAFEVVYHHASTNEAPRTQSFQELLNSDICSSYEDDFLPPRSWGYAGRKPFDSDEQ